MSMERQSSELLSVITWITQYPSEKMDFASILDETVADLNGLVSYESVKRALLCFVSAAVAVFDREPEGMPISEQKLTMRNNVRSPSALNTRLQKSAKEKLVTVLGSVKDDIFEEVLPNLA